MLSSSFFSVLRRWIFAYIFFDIFSSYITRSSHAYMLRFFISALFCVFLMPSSCSSQLSVVPGMRLNRIKGVLRGRMRMMTRMIPSDNEKAVVCVLGRIKKLERSRRRWNERALYSMREGRDGGTELEWDGAAGEWELRINIPDNPPSHCSLLLCDCSRLCAVTLRDDNSSSFSWFTQTSPSSVRR